MISELRERARWLESNVLPHERLVRSRLGQLRIPNLDIDDVIQEMYTRILTVPSVEAIRYPRQYAVQTAKSIVIDHVRRSKIVPIVSHGSIEKLPVAVPGGSAEARLEFQDEINEVADALAQLPSACRETLLLRRIEGLSQKETAQRMKISEKAVEKHMSRGVCFLIRLFGHGGKTTPRASRCEENFGSEKDADLEPGG